MTIKAAMFVDNSNIFKGTEAFSRKLYKAGKLEPGKYLRIRWDKLVKKLEGQNGGTDIFARHFFASLPPAADVTKLPKRPTQKEWEALVKTSAQTGFYKAIQSPPLNFTLHGIPLRFAEVYCRRRIKSAYYKCRDAQCGEIKCSLRLDTDECYNCKRTFLFKFEKGVDVGLAVSLVIFAGTSAANLDQVMIVAGDGDFKDAAQYVRRQLGKDLQIISWRKALSRELKQIANKPVFFLDDHWEDLCEIRRMAPLDEIPAADVDAVDEQDEDASP